MEIYGPVASRRLGLSLGINHLPPKTCSYSCVYCQLGRTSFLTTTWTAYSQSEKVFHEVRARLDALAAQGIHPDYVTFVSNGEPTLDRSISETIAMLKADGIRTAVISNASLLWHPGIRAGLMEADVVSVKVDTLNEATWHRLDRPHGTLVFKEVLAGIRRFAASYGGRLLTETMLVAGVNDSDEEADQTAAFIASLQPAAAYLSLPLRPPAESRVTPPDAERLIAVFQHYQKVLPAVELLMELPETDLPGTSQPVAELLKTLKVHPLEEAEIRRYFDKHTIPATMLDDLVQEGEILKLMRGDKAFFVSNYLNRS
jgi:wyosine [tRNA(Phe)-imidazoG37] synthetase (radical SAM superfamily)